MKHVDFETAILLSKIGFPQPRCGHFYKEDGEIENGLTDLGEGIYYAATWYEVLDWLRETKKHHIETTRMFGQWVSRILVLCDYNGEHNPHLEFRGGSYYDCLIPAVKKALEICV